MASSLITLITDFGLGDHYVGVMKGVIAGIHPTAHLIDICHEIDSYNVAKAAFTIAQAYRYFPKDTVHLIVVDPGVGTKRRPILVEAAHQYFVAPDNGVLSQIYEQEEHVVRAIDVDQYALEPISHTFHGRDVFAPVAAWLSKGTPPRRVGEKIDEYVRLPSTEPVFVKQSHWRGRILNIDRFGNLVTSFPAELAQDVTSRFRIVAGRLETSTCTTSYAHARAGEPFAIAGSSGYLEISINQASAAEAAGVKTGDEIEVIFTDVQPTGDDLLPRP